MCKECFTMHLNDSSSIAIHLKTHSTPKSKFRNNTIISYEINKRRLRILEALPIKTKNTRINRISFEKKETMFSNAF